MKVNSIWLWLVIRFNYIFYLYVMIKHNTHHMSFGHQHSPKQMKTTSIFGEAARNQQQFDTFQWQQNDVLNLQSNKDSLLFTQSRKQDRRGQSANVFNQLNQSPSHNIINQYNKQHNQIHHNPHQNTHNSLSAYVVTPFDLKHSKKECYRGDQAAKKSKVLDQSGTKCEKCDLGYKRQLSFLSKNNRELYYQIKVISNQNESYKNNLKTVQQQCCLLTQTNQKLNKEITDYKSRQKQFKDKYSNLELRYNTLNESYHHRQLIALKEHQQNLQHTMEEYKIVSKLNECIQRQQKDKEKQIKMQKLTCKQNYPPKDHAEEKMNCIEKGSQGRWNMNSNGSSQFKRFKTDAFQQTNQDMWKMSKLKSFEQSKSTNLFSEGFHDKSSPKTTATLKNDKKKKDSLLALTNENKNYSEFSYGGKRAKTEYIQHVDSLGNSGPWRQNYRAKVVDMYGRQLQAELKTKVQRLSRQKKKKLQEVGKNSVAFSTSPTEMAEQILNKIGKVKDTPSKHTINKSSSFYNAPYISHSIIKTNRTKQR